MLIIFMLLIFTSFFFDKLLTKSPFRCVDAQQCEELCERRVNDVDEFKCIFLRKYYICSLIYIKMDSRKDIYSNHKWKINSMQKYILFTEQIDYLMLFECHQIHPFALNDPLQYPCFFLFKAFAGNRALIINVRITN